jgi:hypothetical protein
LDENNFTIFLATKRNINDLAVYTARSTVNATERVIAIILKYIL